MVDLEQVVVVDRKQVVVGVAEVVVNVAEVVVEAVAGTIAVGLMRNQARPY